MKICILGDSHFGLRRGDVRFINYFDKVYTDWFFPTIKKRGIKTILQLGDLYDDRRGNDSRSVSEANRYFFDVAQDEDITIHTLLGNHDLFHKHSLSVNSQEILLKDYKNIVIHKEPTIWENISIIPWICQENQVEVIKYIQNDSSKFLACHPEISGFKMYKHVKAHDGLSRSLFKNYELVLAGHYHHRSHQENILYTGAPAEYTWSDANDPKGIHIFDTETGEIEFIVNPYTMHEVVEYNEDEPFTDFVSLTDKFVRLYVLKADDRKKYDKFVDAINKANPHELKIIEEQITIKSHRDEDVDIKDTPALIENTIDNMETDLKKDRLNMMMRRFYIEAQSEGKE